VLHIETLLARGAALVSVLDRHLATHAWLSAVRGQRVVPLGPDRFGQSRDIPNLYREYGLDTDAILDACAHAMLARNGGMPQVVTKGLPIVMENGSVSEL
jgi:pyruvate dehydrogenase E1 component